jgi:hypothetical protein
MLHLSKAVWPQLQNYKSLTTTSHLSSQISDYIRRFVGGNISPDAMTVFWRPELCDSGKVTSRICREQTMLKLRRK